MAKRLDHNESGGLAPDTFLRLYRELRQARAPMETAIANYRVALKRMKDGGVDTFALSVLEKLTKVEEEQASLHIRNLFRYANWTGANVGLQQPDLFGGTDDQQPTQEAVALFTDQQAEENGYRTGRARESADNNPHEGGSSQHAAWARGWHRGQGEEVMEQFGAKAPKQPTRRARNPAAETREAPDAAPGAEDATGDDGADAEDMDTSKVVPIGRGARGRSRAAAASTPRARKAAVDAADKLTGTPVADSPAVF